MRNLVIAVLLVIVALQALVMLELRRVQGDVVTLTVALETLSATISSVDENLDPVEYFVYDNGTIKIERSNGETVVYCLRNADCDN